MNPLKKQIIKKVLNYSLIIGTFIGSVYFAVRSGDVGQIGRALLSMDLLWLLAAFGCFGVHAFLEGFIPYVFFRFQKVQTSLKSNIIIGLIGMYYSSITPAATGGQPMQVYAHKKRGVAPGIASSALAIKFFCWQSSVLLLGALLWIMFPSLVSVHMKDAVWLLPIGFFVNGIAVVAVVLITFGRGIIRAIIIFAVSVLHKIHIVKDKAKAASKMDAALSDFQSSVTLISRQPKQFLVLFLLSVLQVLALMSAIYFIYRGLGLTGTPYLHLLTIQLMLFIAASFTPLPGSSGAQEGGFYLFFSPFFSENLLFAAMFIWRFVTYYLSIIVGFGAVMMDSGKKNVKISEVKK